jgi:hypothetical protein
MLFPEGAAWMLNRLDVLREDGHARLHRCPTGVLEKLTQGGGENARTSVLVVLGDAQRRGDDGRHSDLL